MSQDPDNSSDFSRSSQSPPVELKRKREATEDDELEIDLNLPEPLSKKASRKLKKSKTDKPKAESAQTSETAREDVTAKETTSTRSEWGIWIGNLLWSTTKDHLREFLSEKGNIPKSAITRLHMPPPAAKGPAWKGPKPVNKGFGYIDFDTEDSMNKAIALSETLLDGRKVLIKNAKSFEGRPELKATDAPPVPEKAPSKRIFVGNLDFNTTVADVREHFEQAGVVEDVFLTTFEDSGKCKGYGWVRFADVDAAQSAVSGFVYKSAAVEEDDGTADVGDTKSKKPRKWFINRLQGRSLRTEFAEDSQTRYKKRFGKDQPKSEESEPRAASKPSRKLDKDERQAQRRQRHEDARLIAPGKALATAQRASAAIVTAAGTKTTFD